MTEKLMLVVGVTTLCMLSPGPDMVLVMRNTLTRDRRAGGLTALGVLTGNMVHIGYCVFGLALLLTQSPALFDALRIAGALYLIYLGVQGLRSRGGSLGDDAVSSAGVRHPGPAYTQGLVNNLLNPKGSLFYLGVFSQLVTPDMTAAQTVLLIAVMMSVSAAFWVVFVLALRMPMVRVRLDRHAMAIDRVFGVVLILFGAKIALWR